MPNINLSIILISILFVIIRALVFYLCADVADGGSPNANLNPNPLLAFEQRIPSPLSDCNQRRKCNNDTGKAVCASNGQVYETECAMFHSGNCR